MAEIKIASIGLTIDATEAVNQISEIIGLLKLPSTAFEGVPEHVFDLFLGNISSLLDNISLGDFSATVSAANANEICFKVKIIGTLEHVATAIRTGNLQSLIFDH
ncbi:hypothetical protein G9G39_22725 [Cronobacter sp. EKM101R]|uniref:hypothetical protein n=1 Tax=unclassified Cronobacter TaxID=2649764 RepID=UPI0013E9FBB3|nr:MULTISPECIES: hypothetical protein [Cronobacter]KAF6589082.1 hypothetical protein G9G39_22725 [Cronobacter sp. EKM101R]KAF6592371.1 hypothetical protein G9G38_22735 [Cronobacter sp. EKM102R]MDK1184612.1 hypothetical protein [Cronobacter turicensis]MDK1192238.1 hypothetical protein [Cronobacter dublinensis]MDK1201831.1 hypothetical protein [Cronobacter dublinensis]